MVEQSFVYEALLRFLDTDFILGVKEAVLEMVAADIYCVGVQGEIPAFNREEFSKLLEQHILENPSSSVHEVNG